LDLPFSGSAVACVTHLFRACTCRFCRANALPAPLPPPATCVTSPGFHRCRSACAQIASPAVLPGSVPACLEPLPADFKPLPAWIPARFSLQVWITLPLQVFLPASFVLLHLPAFCLWGASAVAWMPLRFLGCAVTPAAPHRLPLPFPACRFTPPRSFCHLLPLFCLHFHLPFCLSFCRFLPGSPFARSACRLPHTAAPPLHLLPLFSGSTTTVSPGAPACRCRFPPPSCRFLPAACLRLRCRSFCLVCLSSALPLVLSPFLPSCRSFCSLHRLPLDFSHRRYRSAIPRSAVSVRWVRSADLQILCVGFCCRSACGSLAWILPPAGAAAVSAGTFLPRMHHLRACRLGYSALPPARVAADACLWNTSCLPACAVYRSAASLGAERGFCLEHWIPFWFATCLYLRFIHTWRHACLCRLRFACLTPAVTDSACLRLPAPAAAPGCLRSAVFLPACHSMVPFNTNACRYRCCLLRASLPASWVAACVLPAVARVLSTLDSAAAGFLLSAVSACRLPRVRVLPFAACPRAQRGSAAVCLPAAVSAVLPAAGFAGYLPHARALKNARVYWFRFRLPPAIARSASAFVRYLLPISPAV